MRAEPENCYFALPACLIKALHAAEVEHDVVEHNDIENMDDEEEERERRCVRACVRACVCVRVYVCMCVWCAHLRVGVFLTRTRSIRPVEHVRVCVRVRACVRAFVSAGIATRNPSIC